MQTDTSPIEGAAAYPRLAFLVGKFRRAIELRDRHDGEVIAGLVRVLRNPRGDVRQDAEHFAEIVRAIVRQELSA